MEASPGLRKMQRQTLCGIPLSEEQVGGGSREGITAAMRPDGLQISWHDVFDDLPGMRTMIGHIVSFCLSFNIQKRFRLTQPWYYLLDPIR